MADAVPALSALPRAETPVWGFARTRPADLGPLWASLDAADDAVGEALRVVDTLPTTARGVVEGATTSADLGSAVWLLSASSTDPAVAVEARSDRWRAAREELWQRTREARESAASLMGRFAPEVASVDVEPVRQELREASTSFFIGRKGRLVRAAAPVLAHLRPGAEVDPKTLPAVVEEVARVRRLVGDIALSWRRLPGCAALDPAVNVLSEAGWQAVSDAVSAVERDRDLLAGLPANLSDGVQASRRFGEPLGPSEHRTLDAAGRALSAAVTHTGGSSEDEARFARGRGVLRTWAATAAERRADRPRGAALGRWVEASEALAPLGEALGEARWALLTGAVSPDDGPEALDRGLAAASVAERWDAAGFGSFEADRQDRTVSRFVDASERLRSSLTTALPAALLDRRPFRPGAFFGKVGALEREIGRTRGGLSVRRLVEQYGEVIGAITPCVLVSPDSLARFVPPGSMSFDLVVFDEASQISVADAVGAMGRADAAVVVGDSKQMPPSVFAELSMDDADAVEAEFQVVPDEESILTECVQAGCRRRWLSWHYRSQDESLIAFSNAAYYENRLSSFPAHPAQSHDTGVSFTRVAGTFLRSARGAGLDKGALRTNPVEAAAVVAEVLRRWQARERSIGVVTFNIQQRALIESMLEESGDEGLAEALAAKRDGLFVKNLENVQGDERDVILFSTGFSANADGVLPLNFGPLNRSGGERRLNVAVTRARRQVMVFSSFEPEDLRVEQTSSVGIRDLRRYLEVAKYGVATTPAAVSAGQVGVDRHRDDIAAALRSAGLDVATAVGLSEFQIDLTVAPRGEPMALAVLLDSPAWAERRTTSDRDALPVVVLERIMGWPKVVRVWLPDWLEDRDSVVARLVVAAGEAASAPRRVGERVVTTSAGMRVAAEGPQDAVGAVDAVDAVGATDGVDAVDAPMLPADFSARDDLSSDIPDIGPNNSSRAELSTADPIGLVTAVDGLEEPYVPFVSDVIGRRNALDSLPGGRYVGEVQAVIRDVVETEGPVSPTRLAKLVAHAYGLSRVLDDRVAQINRAVPADLRRDPEEGFVWPDARDPLRWRGFRRTTGSPKERPLDDVALREIGNAMATIAEHAMGITRDELAKETYRVFGGTRVTPTARERLDRAMEVIVREGRVQVVAGVVIPRR